MSKMQNRLAAKKALFIFFALLFAFMALGGCASNESEPVKLVRAMMRLDYMNMSVRDFHAAIEKLCEDAGTTVPAVYHDVTEEFTIPGAYGPPRYGDENLAAFMATTLQYSSVEITAQHAGETPSYPGVVMYLTVPGKTAKEVDQIMQGNADEAAHFAEENAETLNTFPILLYYVEGLILDTGALTVSERDTRLRSIHTTLRDTFLSLTIDEAMANALEKQLEAEFEQLAAAYSDASMTIRCVVDGIARESDLQAGEDDI